MAVPTLGKKAAIVVRIIGRIGNAVYANVKGKKLILRSVYRERKVSAAQLAWREKYNIPDKVWIGMSVEERNAWRPLAVFRGQSNYSVFMHVNLLRVKEGKEPITNPNELEV